MTIIKAFLAVNVAVKLHILPSSLLFFYKGNTNKSLLETNQVCVAMAGDWSVAMAGRKTVEDSVRVREVSTDLKTGLQSMNEREYDWLNDNHDA